MPSDLVLQQSFDAFLSAFYPLCPLFNRHQVQDALHQGQHWQDGDLQALLLAITGLIETAAQLQNGSGATENERHNAPGPFLLKAVGVVALRSSAASESTYTASASLILSIAYHSLGEMQTSLYWIQHSITLAQIRLDCHRLHMKRAAQDLENKLRLGWML